MNQGNEFLSIKDLMVLMGTEHYTSAYRRHKGIRDAIKAGKKGLTIREYCEFEGFDYSEIRAMIRQR